MLFMVYENIATQSRLNSEFRRFFGPVLTTESFTVRYDSWRDAVYLQSKDDKLWAFDFCLETKSCPIWSEA